MRPFVVWMVVGGVALASPPSLFWRAELSWELPVTFSTKMELLWTLPLWAWKGSVEIRDGVWRSMGLSGSGKIGFLEVFPLVSFDPQGPRFSGATLIWKHPAIPGEEARPSRGCA